MQILTIGDIHGENWWKDIADISQLLNSTSKIPFYDKYIFLGDYTDSYELSTTIILHNLKEIIKFKTMYPDHVILLIGNHDLFYITMDFTHGSSGNRPEVMHDFYNIFKPNRKLFKLAYEIDTNNHKYLWTHAGVHQGWHNHRYSKFVLNENKNLAWNLNDLYQRNAECIFDVGRKRGGYQDVGSPFWLDLEYGSKKPLKGYHQIVGHTQTKEIKRFYKGKYTSIIYCDVNNSNEYYVLNI